MIPTSSIKSFKLFRKDEQYKVSESVEPAIRQAKSAENLVQVLPNALKCPCVSIKHALKKQSIKTLKPLISQGFQVSVSILATQDGCGDRTRTCDLRVMRQSQAQIGVISAPICAFYRRSLGEFSVVSVRPCPLFSDSGSKVGQAQSSEYR